MWPTAPPCCATTSEPSTGKITNTPVGVDVLGSSVGRAADSRRYLALLPGQRTGGSVEPGALQYLNPHGTLGQRVNIQGGMVGGAGSYSPSRRYVIADASDIMSARPVPSAIVDVSTGQVVAPITAGAKPIGRHDEKTVALLAPRWTNKPVLELVDVSTGTETKKIDLPNLPSPVAIHIAASAGLTGQASRLGF